nr:dUTP diphosphatase [Terribacillus saccharophilus]
MENIDYKDEDKSAKVFLAIVELGEFANEWHGFKYWSKEETRVHLNTC